MSSQAQKERDSTIGLTKGSFYWGGISFVAQRDDPTWRKTPEELAQIEAALEDSRWKATA